MTDDFDDGVAWWRSESARRRDRQGEGAFPSQEQRLVFEHIRRALDDREASEARRRSELEAAVVVAAASPQSRCASCQTPRLPAQLYVTADGARICLGCAQRFATERAKEARVMVLAYSFREADAARVEAGLRTSEWCYAADLESVRGIPPGARYLVVEGFWRRSDGTKVLEYLSGRGREVTMEELRMKRAESEPESVRGIRVREGGGDE